MWIRTAPKLAAIAMLTFCGCVSAAESVAAQAPTSLKSNAVPTIRFTFDHDALDVPHFEIEVDVTGKAQYESRGKPDPASGEADTFKKNITISPATRDRIFGLAKSADYFNGSFDFTKHKIAFSGTKTLTYSDGIRSGTAKFNWSENAEVTELAAIFEGISATLEAEPRLEHLRRFDRLGLNAELAKLEQQANSGWLRELGLISGTLREIAEDGNIMSLARHRAERLLQLASESK